MIKSSIYFYLFNIKRYGFDVEGTLANFCAFADEVVCATIPDDDNSWAILSEFEKKYSNFRVVLTNIPLTDNRFDGKLKTVALKATTHPIKIIADGDERFVLSQKGLWQIYFETLLRARDLDGMMIPVIDLWGDKNHIRMAHQIGQKFRIHKNTIVARGVIPEAEMEEGKFDTSRSDSTEPLTQNGTLGSFTSVVDYSNLFPIFCSNLIGKPYVIHEGYLDLQKRAKINSEFWKKHWENRSGREENVVTTEEVLRKEQLIQHNLPLE
jgi:hypothetical protein